MKMKQRSKEHDTYHEQDVPFAEVGTGNCKSRSSMFYTYPLSKALERLLIYTVICQLWATSHGDKKR